MGGRFTRPETVRVNDYRILEDEHHVVFCVRAASNGVDSTRVIEMPGSNDKLKTLSVSRTSITALALLCNQQWRANGKNPYLSDLHDGMAATAVVLRRYCVFGY